MSCSFWPLCCSKAQRTHSSASCVSQSSSTLELQSSCTCPCYCAHNGQCIMQSQIDKGRRQQQHEVQRCVHLVSTMCHIQAFAPDLVVACQCMAEAYAPNVAKQTVLRNRHSIEPVFPAVLRNSLHWHSSAAMSLLSSSV